MSTRQHCTPLMIADGQAVPLRGVPLAERSFSEGWFQQLLFEHPQLIPVEGIEPVFAPLLPLARELPTPVGPVDLVYISPAGYLTLVETKLWRNPEARRHVVAQIMDYAAAMSKWTYEDLAAAVRRANCINDAGHDPLLQIASNEQEIDPSEFIDNVSRNLARGRLLLLIVGDGIQEGVEHLTETLSRTPHLGFSLGLVEMALFRAQSETGPLIVQPRLIARTREVVRAIIELRSGIDPASVVVSLPATEDEDQGSSRRRLTDEVFLEELAASTSAEVSMSLRQFLKKAEAIGVEPTGRAASVSLFWHEPTTGRRFTMGSITARGGALETYFVRKALSDAGLPVELANKYLSEVAALIPGAVVKERGVVGSGSGSWRPASVQNGGQPVPIADLLSRADAWLSAIERLMGQIEQATSVADA